MSKHQNMLRIVKMIAVIKLFLGFALLIGSIFVGGFTDQNLLFMIALGFFIAIGFVVIMVSFMSVLDRREILKSQ